MLLKYPILTVGKCTTKGCLPPYRNVQLVEALIRIIMIGIGANQYASNDIISNFISTAVGDCYYYLLIRIESKYWKQGDWSQKFKPVVCPLPRSSQRFPRVPPEQRHELHLSPISERTLHGTVTLLIYSYFRIHHHGSVFEL